MENRSRQGPLPRRMLIVYLLIELLYDAKAIRSRVCSKIPPRFRVEERHCRSSGGRIISRVETTPHGMNHTFARFTRESRPAVTVTGHAAARRS